MNSLLVHFEQAPSGFELSSIGIGFIVVAAAVNLGLCLYFYLTRNKNSKLP